MDLGRSRMPLATGLVAPASRVVRGHRVAFGNRRRDRSTWIDRNLGTMRATGRPAERGSDQTGEVGTDEEEGGMFVVEPTESDDEHRKEAGGMWMTRLMPVAANPTEGGST